MHYAEINKFRSLASCGQAIKLDSQSLDRGAIHDYFRTLAPIGELMHGRRLAADRTRDAVKQKAVVDVPQRCGAPASRIRSINERPDAPGRSTSLPGTWATGSPPRQQPFYATYDDKLIQQLNTNFLETPVLAEPVTEFARPESSIEP